MWRCYRLFIGKGWRNVCQWSVIYYCLYFNCNGLQHLHRKIWSSNRVSQTRFRYSDWYHGERFGINFQDVPLFARLSLTSVDFASFAIVPEARYVDPLSETIIGGKDFLLLNLLNTTKNDSSVRSKTISRCTFTTFAQVKRHTCSLFSYPCVSLSYKGPEKSIPVIVNGGASVSRFSGNGGGSVSSYHHIYGKINTAVEHF